MCINYMNVALMRKLIYIQMCLMTTSGRDTYVNKLYLQTVKKNALTHRITNKIIQFINHTVTGDIRRPWFTLNNLIVPACYSN